jgi:hypothetical protein
MNIEERRQHPRKKVSDPIPVRDEDRGEILGYLVDISLGGFMVLGNQAIATGRVFRLGLELPQPAGTEPLRLGAESLWVEESSDAGKFWIGFQIIDISRTDVLRLRRLIDELR